MQGNYGAAVSEVFFLALLLVIGIVVLFYLVLRGDHLIMREFLDKFDQQQAPKRAHKREPTVLISTGIVLQRNPMHSNSNRNLLRTASGRNLADNDVGAAAPRVDTADAVNAADDVLPTHVVEQPGGKPRGRKDTHRARHDTANDSKDWTETANMASTRRKGRKPPNVLARAASALRLQVAM